MQETQVYLESVSIPQLLPAHSPNTSELLETGNHIKLKSANLSIGLSQFSITQTTATPHPSHASSLQCRKHNLVDPGL